MTLDTPVSCLDFPSLLYLHKVRYVIYCTKTVIIFNSIQVNMCSEESNGIKSNEVLFLYMVELTKKVKHISFATNPCRIRFYTQEMVIFRDDLLKKMQRHLVMSPDLSEGSPALVEQLVRSILDQGHLCPLPAYARPIQWELDHAMRLFPLPHLVRS